RSARVLPRLGIEARTCLRMPVVSAKKFKELVNGIKSPTVLEIGTKRVEPKHPTIRRDWVPHAAEYIGTDFESGLDVDVVADVNNLSSTFGEQRFDAII